MWTLAIPYHSLKDRTEQLWTLNWKPPRGFGFGPSCFCYPNSPNQNLVLNAKRLQAATEAVDVVVAKNENDLRSKVFLELLEPELLAQGKIEGDLNRIRCRFLQTWWTVTGTKFEADLWFSHVSNPTLFIVRRFT